MLTRSIVRVVLVAALVLAPTVAAHAGPVCPGDDKSACGGRTVPEPMQSLSFLSPGEFVDAMESLAAEFPGWVTNEVMGTSAGGLDILLVEVTDPDAPTPVADRPLLYISQSIHGGEMGGREGMARVVEDLVRTDDADVKDLLGKLRVVQFIPNADGWAAGDVQSGGLAFSRGNDNGTDLNRQFPWPGWIPESREPVSEPEAQVVVDDVLERKLAGEEVVGSVDIHGFNQQYGAWVMLSSGEFDWSEVARQVQIGESVNAQLDEVLGDDAVFQIGAALGGQVGPHIFTSSSEWSGGLSGSGFLGDWLAQEGGLGTNSISTIELFLINGQNTLMYERNLAQIHVDAVRAIVSGMMQTAFEEPDPAVTLDGPVGYLESAQEVTHATVEGAVTPMRFFDDLAPFTSEELVAAVPGAVAAALDGVVAFVATSDQLSDEDVAALRSFAEDGGTVVLTDGGLSALPGLFDDIAVDAVSEELTEFGNADFVDRDHPLAANVRATAIHTYEPATLGYDTEFETPQAPVWTVTQEAWDAVGGVTVATTNDLPSIGEAALGDGVVRILGGLLPPAITDNKVLFGLSNYAPIDTGYYVFFNALAADIASAPTPPPGGGGGTPDPAPDTDAPATPTTGGGLVPLAFVMVAGGAALAARRR